MHETSHRYRFFLNIDAVLGLVERDGDFLVLSVRQGNDCTSRENDVIFFTVGRREQPMAKFVRWLVAIWLIGAIAIAALAAISGIADEACRSKWAEAHLHSKFKAGTGCVVLVNGAWVPSADVHTTVILDAIVNDCRAEVEAAFQKLQLPGRPYRRETTMSTSVHAADPRGVQVFREIAEFIRPNETGGSLTTKVGFQLN